MDHALGKLIHVGWILKQGPTHVFLRQVNPHSYTWFIEDSHEQEIETSISAPTIEEALRLAHQRWKEQSFRTLICGFRYSLPERDEHGSNALFYHMVASYTSSSGVYFDDEWGNNCIVHYASQEALDLWRKLHKNSRL